jgi:hypothetical protein
MANVRKAHRQHVEVRGGTNPPEAAGTITGYSVTVKYPFTRR